MPRVSGEDLHAAAVTCARTNDVAGVNGYVEAFDSEAKTRARLHRRAHGRTLLTEAMWWGAADTFRYLLDMEPTVRRHPPHNAPLLVALQTTRPFFRAMAAYYQQQWDDDYMDIRTLLPHVEACAVHAAGTGATWALEALIGHGFLQPWEPLDGYFDPQFKGATLWHVAAARGSLRTLRWLAARRGDRRRQYGGNPVDVPEPPRKFRKCAGGRRVSVASPSRRSVFPAVQVLDAHGASALHWAARRSQTEACAYLLLRGADVNLPTDTRTQPLHLACFTGSDPTARLLLRHGADVGARDADGNTPLHWACMTNCHGGVVGALCAIYSAPAARARSRAAFSVANGMGCIPMHLACYAPGGQTMKALLAGECPPHARPARPAQSGDRFMDVTVLDLFRGWRAKLLAGKTDGLRPEEWEPVLENEAWLWRAVWSTDCPDRADPCCCLMDAAQRDCPGDHVACAEWSVWRGDWSHDLAQNGFQSIVYQTALSSVKDPTKDALLVFLSAKIRRQLVQ